MESKLSRYENVLQQIKDWQHDAEMHAWGLSRLDVRRNQILADAKELRMLQREIAGEMPWPIKPQVKFEEDPAPELDPEADPRTATGESLDRMLEAFGCEPRGAGEADASARARLLGWLGGVGADI